MNEFVNCFNQLAFANLFFQICFSQFCPRIRLSLRRITTSKRSVLIFVKSNQVSSSFGQIAYMQVKSPILNFESTKFCFRQFFLSTSVCLPCRSFQLLSEVKIYKNGPVQVYFCRKLFFLQNMGENLMCTKIALNIRNNFCTQNVLPRFELEIFMY